MSEQSDIPDWLKALRPQAAEPPPQESAFAQAPEESLPESPSPPAPPSEFELLRERAAAQPEELEESQGVVSSSALVQVIRSLKPQQRFILSFFLLVNVSTLGCFVLMALQKIDPARIAALFGVP